MASPIETGREMIEDDGTYAYMDDMYELYRPQAAHGGRCARRAGVAKCGKR